VSSWQRAGVFSCWTSTYDCAPPGRNDLQNGFDVSQVSEARPGAPAFVTQGELRHPSKIGRFESGEQMGWFIYLVYFQQHGVFRWPVVAVRFRFYFAKNQV